MKSARIAYIMSRFPGLSETFILREMCELELQGWHISLYPLLFKREPMVHSEAEPWMERAHNPFWLSIGLANLRWFFTEPMKYMTVLLNTLHGNRSSLKFFVRALYVFPKSVWMSHQMRV